MVLDDKVVVRFEELPVGLQLAIHRERLHTMNTLEVERGGETTMKRPLGLDYEKQLEVLAVYNPYAERHRPAIGAAKIIGVIGNYSRCSPLSGIEGGVSVVFDLGGDALRRDLERLEDRFSLQRYSIDNFSIYDMLHNLRFFVDLDLTEQQRRICDEVASTCGAVCSFAVAFLEAVERRASTRGTFLDSFRQTEEANARFHFEGLMLTANLLNVLYYIEDEDRLGDFVLEVMMAVPPLRDVEGLKSTFKYTVPASDVLNSLLLPLTYVANTIGEQAQDDLVRAIKAALQDHKDALSAVDESMTLKVVKNLIETGATQIGISRAIGIIVTLRNTESGERLDLNRARKHEFHSRLGMGEPASEPPPASSRQWPDRDFKDTLLPAALVGPHGKEAAFESFVELCALLDKSVAEERLLGKSAEARGGAGHVGGPACAAEGKEETKRRYDAGEISYKDAVDENGDFKDWYALDRGNATAAAGKEETKRRYDAGEISYKDAVDENGDFKDWYALHRGHATTAAGQEVMAVRLANGEISHKDATRKDGELKSALHMDQALATAAAGQEVMAVRLANGEISHKDAMRQDGKLKSAYRVDQALAARDKHDDPVSGAMFLICAGLNPRLVALLSPICLGTCGRGVYERKRDEATLSSRVMARDKKDGPGKKCIAHYLLQSKCEDCNEACPHGEGKRYRCTICVRSMRMEMVAAAGGP